MGNDIENKVLVFVLHGDVMDEIITYFSTTYDNKFQLLTLHNNAFEFTILTKNEPFHEIINIYKEYIGKVFIRNLWEDLDSGHAGILIYDKECNIKPFNWEQPIANLTYGEDVDDDSDDSDNE
jgi:hypothetical protein